MKKILVKGYGSIGRRHAANLKFLGYEPVILTSQNTEEIPYMSISKWSELPTVKEAIICSETRDHLRDLVDCQEAGINKILLEKPLYTEPLSGDQYNNFKKIEIFLAYNMKFLKCFKLIQDYLKENGHQIKKVNIYCGQYLPDWRPGRDYRTTYSAIKSRGGGVHLDLSHELDYMLWLFGKPERYHVFKDSISDLEIDSCDCFTGYYYYTKLSGKFVSLVELDYIKNDTDRRLSIYSEDAEDLFCDFIAETVQIKRGKQVIKEYKDKNLFDFDESYRQELIDFLSDKPEILTTLEEGQQVMELIQG